MKNLLKILLAGFGMACIALLILSGSRQKDEGFMEELNSYEEGYVTIEELPALLDFYYYTAKEWEEKLGQESFGRIVTPETLSWLIEQTGTAEYITYDPKENETADRAAFNSIYGQILDLLDDQGQIQMKEEVLLKKEGNAFRCSSGTYRCSLNGLEIEEMTAASFYVKGDEIIGIYSRSSKFAQLSNVYVSSADKKQLKFLLDNETYALGLSLENPKSIQNRVCNLLWKNGKISKVQVKEDTIQGNLIAINEDSIEIEGYGKISCPKDLPVYKTYGTIEEKELSDIVIANMKAEYVVAGDCVEAVLLTEPAQISKIRVLLLAESFGIYRENIYISADAPCQVICRGEKIEEKEGVLISASELFEKMPGETSIQISSVTEEKEELYLCDENGKRISNGYLGSLELRKYGEGFTVVNELPIEQYLCAVVPSEMPKSYEMEALKAQAICARSYAYIQLERGDYAAFGAHVDDTTNYQVYNKQAKDKKTTDAVLDTAGKVMKFNGNVAEAYYFSTSAGIVGNGDSWGLTGNPGYGYLRNGAVKEGGGEIDFSKEEDFKQYITNSDETAYESERPYFRWKAIGAYSSKKTSGRIRKILNARKERTPDDIVFLNEKQEETDTMAKFGKFQKIQVIKRGRSGVILQIQIDYEKGTILIGNEYNIRAVFGAGMKKLTLSDGSQKEAALLPSAYAVLEPSENGTYQIFGGGYGHGIGMSQNGAAAMAEDGKSCEEILNFFFQNIEIADVL